MNRLKLPIGIQSFRTIREEGYYHVDNTPQIRELTDRGFYYFLSRPYGFGKSLLVDTLRELFEGNEPLFRGLDIHQHWDWSTQYQVVRLGFDGKYDEPADIEADLVDQLQVVERDLGIDPPKSFDKASSRFMYLLSTLDRSVVLVDDYDKPLLDVIDKPEMAKAIRDYLMGFYGIIKGSGRNARFVLLTGVNMLPRASMFSGLNHLLNVSLDPAYATICGYTDRDLDTVFAPELPGLDRDEIRRWYNGYHWLGDERVYNPFALLQLFRKREFEPYWFEAQSSTHLFRRMMDRNICPMALENRVVDQSLISKFDPEDPYLEAQLFQAGHLTIVEKDQDRFMPRYTIDCPNFEVRYGLNRSLLSFLGQEDETVSDCGKDLVRLLAENDAAGFANRLGSFFAGIPCRWQDTKKPVRYDMWYAGMLYSCFQTVGLDIRVEDHTGYGPTDMDMAVFHDGRGFVFGFGMAEEADDRDSAVHGIIEKMRERDYAGKYRDRGVPVHLVGIAISTRERNPAAVEMLPA